MNEISIRFGEGNRLSGIACFPDDASTVQQRPAVVFISAGLLPKSGPYRMYTELSRSIASLGFATLRFDLSGNGDSLGSITAASADRTTVEDTKTALDEMQHRYGFQQFILLGLCSGAEASHKTALADVRVAGIVSLDGFISKNITYYFWHYLPRVFSLDKWQDFFRSKTRRLLNSGQDESYPRDSSVNFWNDEYPGRRQLAAEYKHLCDRNVRQLMIFSGGSQNCSYERQFHDVFSDVPCRSLVDVYLFRKADHTYVLSKDRRSLQRVVCRWLRTRFANDRSSQESVPCKPERRYLIKRERPANSTLNRTVDSAPRRGEEF